MGSERRPIIVETNHLVDTPYDHLGRRGRIGTGRGVAKMYTDDIPQEWVGEEIGCYTTQDSAKGPHIGTLLKIGNESLIIEENQDPTLYNMAFVYKIVLRGEGEKEIGASGRVGSRKAAAPIPPARQCEEDH